MQFTDLLPISIEGLNLLIRGAVIGLAMLFVILEVRLPDRKTRYLALVLTASVMAYLLLGCADAGRWPREWLIGLRLLAVCGPYCFWALSRLLFEDRFSFRPWHAVIVSVMLVSSVTRSLLEQDSSANIMLLPRLGVTLPALGLALHVMWRVVRDRRDDLSEVRRSFRLVFLGAGATFTIVILLSRWLWELKPIMAEVRLVQALAFLGLKLVVVSQLIEFRPLMLTMYKGSQLPKNEQIVPSDTSEDAELVERILNAMQQKNIYREAGLTISELATQICLPEYRLRKLINQHLGYRNFTDFLNSWRLREAAERLRDPSQMRIPILTIALEVGYGSIGPFNRAFKSFMGVTPSEYRRGNGDRSLADS